MYMTDENIDRSISMINTEISHILDRGELSKETLCLLGEMVDILKDFKEIDEAGMDEGYSQRGYSYARDRMGRYTSHDYGGDSMRSMRYSRASEPTHKEQLMDKFMAQASNENERELVRRILNEM